MKIVLNECYGGFHLSYEAQALYVIASGKTPYFYADVSSYDDYRKKHRYKLVTLDEVNKIKNQLYIYCSTTDQGKYVDHFPFDTVDFKNISRSDPILVSVIETMGSETASGRFASLEIQEIPDGTLYQIDYYDGLEVLITQDDDDWLMAADNKCAPEVEAQIKNIWATMKPSPTIDPDLMFRYDK